MNPNNYCTLEAAKRLVEAGIVLETEAHWYLVPALSENEEERWILSFDYDGIMKSLHRIPAPTMAEVWRELPEETAVYRGQELSEAFIYDKSTQSSINKNPTDALIDLLIRVRKEAE